MNNIVLPKEKEFLLINYYEKTIGIEEDCSYEIVIYTYDDNNLLKEEYNNNTIKKSLVPIDLFYEVIGIINKYELSKWNELIDYYSLDGKQIIFKYYDGNNIIRISSDQMTDNGEEIFNELLNILIK